MFASNLRLLLGVSVFVTVSLLLPSGMAQAPSPTTTTPATSVSPLPTRSATLSPKCLDTARSLSSDKCMEPLIKASQAFDTVEQEDQFYKVAGDLIRNLCGDACNSAWRKMASTIAEGCTAELVKEWVDDVTDIDKDKLTKEFFTESFNFAKDFACVRNDKANNELCAIQTLDVDKKNKLSFRNEPSIPEASNNTSPANPPSNNNATTPLTPFDVMTSITDVAGFAFLPETASRNRWKALPKADLCTPCTSFLAQQSYTFNKNKVIPLSTNKKANEDAVKEVDLMVKDLNEVCGKDFAKVENANLVLGTDKPATNTAGVAAGSKSAAIRGTTDGRHLAAVLAGVTAVGSLLVV